MQLSDVVMVYFVIGAVMVGGGAVALGGEGGEGAGVAGFFVEQGDDGDLQPSENAASQIDETGGAISAVVSLAVGAIVLVWELALGLFNFLHWPLLVLLQANAPPMAVLLIGGGFTAAFYMAIIGLVWRAA